MTKTETHTNKTILRVLLAAAAVLLLCGAAIGAAAADEGANYEVNGMSYETLSQAYETAIDGDTIKVLQDVTESSQTTMKDDSKSNVTLDLNGHTITANETFDEGLIVYESPSCTLTITDSSTGGSGTLNGNNKSRVLYINEGTVLMTGGTITGGRATDGAGVYVKDGEFKMTGGKITGNTATGNGAGVYISASGKNFIISGSPVIKDNTAGGKQNNVYLCDGRTINFVADEEGEQGLTPGAEIWVTNPGVTSGKQIACGNGDRSLSGDAQYFHPDSGFAGVKEVIDEADFRYLKWDTNPALIKYGGKTYAKEADTDRSYFALIGGEDSPFTATNAEFAADDSLQLTGESPISLEHSLEIVAPKSNDKPFTIDLNGQVLQRDSTKGNFSVITVGSGAELAVKDNSSGKHYFTVQAAGQPWLLDDSKKEGAIPLENITDASQFAPGTIIEVTGGCITGGSADKGGGVYISTGALTMTGGNIVGNSAEDGGGVYNNGGTFTMSGGNIVGNSATDGGGVCIKSAAASKGTFNMTGGKITGNKADNNGGGVYSDTGLFEMTGGKITGNKADNNGGGVYVTGTNSTFTMKNGSLIENNTAAEAGGVYVGGGTFTMEGGEVTGNTAGYTCGGVYVTGGTFNVSKAPVIRDNKMGNADNNVYLPDATRLNLTGAFTGGEIRITNVGSAELRQGDPFGTAETEVTGAEHFVADGDTLLVGSIKIDTGTNKLVWKAGVIVTFDANGHGTAPAKQIVASGNPVTRPADPSAAGYTFGGWYTDDTYDTPYEFSTPVTSDITLYAKWTINTYTVTFNMKGHGTQIPAATVNPGSTVTRPSPDPSAIGCIFGGWFTDSGCTAAYDFDTPVTGNMTLYAKWDIVSYTAKVEDYTYGGTVPQPYVTPADPADVSFFYIREGQAYSWDTLTSITLDAGSYYVRAVDNTGAVEIKDSSFTVNKAEQVKPDISVEAVADGIKTTITNYMSGYTYLYSLDAKNWELVPAGSSSFTIPGLAAETPYTVTVKINAKGNYKESISDSKTVTTLGTFSVSYNANGGVGTIEPQTATMGESITVASSSGISRNGYTFTVWNTKPDGTGDSFAAGAPIDKGAVLYAQWAAQTYTISFDAHGGDVTPLSKTVRYGDSYSLPVATHQGNQTFSGWAVSKNGSVMYAGGQQVKDLGDITLHAVWANKTYGLTVKVLKEDNSTPVEGANVTLKLGSAVFKGPVPSSTDGEVIFSDVPEGNYTLVAEKDGKIVTVAVTVNDKLSDPVRVIIPAGNVSSIVDVKDGTPAVAVGGLAETAADSAKEGDKVTVTVTVETKTEGASASGKTEDQETQIEIEAINKEAKKAADSKTEYLGINIKKQVNEEEPEKITSTANVLEFIIPFDFSGKKNVIAYRCHEGEVKPLEKISGRVLDEKERKDGRYYPDTANGMIYLYSSLFSTYGVNYTTSDTPTPSHSSSSSGTSIWAAETPEPTAVPTPTPTPTPTVTQTPGAEVPTVTPLPTQTGASPAPFAGVIAALGAAAVVFWLRRR